MLWLNGDFLDDNDAQIAATSAGNLLGWGVFTTVGIWNARPFALELHLRRLRHDAKQIGMEFPFDFDNDALRCALQKIIETNAIGRGMARLTLTQRGDGRWNHTEKSDFSIVTQPISSTRSDNWRVALSPFRVHSQRATVGLKTTSYLDYQRAWQEAQSRGFDEAILRNERDEVCEGARSNLFWVCDGILFTPHLQSGCLPGIARGLILSWAHETEICSCEDGFHATDLLAAEELFFSSANGLRRAEAFFDGETTLHFLENTVFSQLQKRWEAEAR